MYSRNGKLFFPPKYFKDALPKMALDGELWSDRNEFQKIVSIVKKQYENDGWQQIKYMVYDAPKLKLPFKERIAAIENCLQEKGSSKYVELVKQDVCESNDYLFKRLDSVMAKKGEGLMLKDPSSKYEQKRSEKLLKVKKFDDAEATVIKHEKGTGRCSGMLGALRVRLDDGTEFKIGSGFDDSQRRKPPKIGSRVTFKY